MSLQYAKYHLQFELAYHMSLFDNDDRSLTWDNYDPDPPPDTPATGSLALAPDNEFHQVTATLGYQLPRNTRFTGVRSTGILTLYLDFQPYCVGGGMPPRCDLEGVVWLTTAQLKVASRPLRKLGVCGGYTYNKRENDSCV